MDQRLPVSGPTTPLERRGGVGCRLLERGLIGDPHSTLPCSRTRRCVLSRSHYAKGLTRLLRARFHKTEVFDVSNYSHLVG